MFWFGWVPQRPVCAQCYCHRQVQQRGDSEEEKTWGWRTSGGEWCDCKTISKQTVRSYRWPKIHSVTRPDPTAWIAALQKSYTSLGRRDSASVIFLLSKHRLAEEPCCKQLWPREWQSPVVSLQTSCRRVGCLHEHMQAQTRQMGVHTRVGACLSVWALHLFIQHLLCQSETPLFRICVEATTSPSPPGALGQTKGLWPLSSFFFRVPSLSRGSGAVINRREPYTA